MTKYKDRRMMSRYLLPDPGGINLIQDITTGPITL